MAYFSNPTPHPPPHTHTLSSSSPTANIAQDLKFPLRGLQATLIVNQRVFVERISVLYNANQGPQAAAIIVAQFQVTFLELLRSSASTFAEMLNERPVNVTTITYNARRLNFAKRPCPPRLPHHLPRLPTPPPHTPPHTHATRSGSPWCAQARQHFREERT